MKFSSEFMEIVDDARGRVNEVSVEDTQEKVAGGANLIDVREDNEWEAGHVKGALHLARGIIERDIVDRFPEKDTELVLYCGGGFRSALAADNLQKMGYTNVWSMDGGVRGWREKQYPMTTE
jgi:rhodanese-related sulfurtransferase